MQLSQQQITQMKARGLDDQTIATLAKQKGYEMPDGRDFLHKAGEVANSLFAGKQVGNYIGTKIGYALASPEDKKNFDQSTPTGMQIAGDVALGATQILGAKLPVASSILGKTAQFGALGAVGGGAESIAAGNGIEQVGKDAISEGLKGALTGFTFGVAEKGLTKATQLLNKTGEKIQAKVLMPSKVDYEDGFDINTIKEFNLGGSLKETFSKTNSELDKLSKELNTKLATNKSPIDLNDVYESTARKLAGSKLESFGVNNQMQGAVDKLREEIITAVGKNGLTSIPEAQVIKRSAGHLGAWNYGNTAPEAKASEKVYNAFYTELKNAIEKASPEGVREVNKKMSRLIPVMNAVIRRMPVAERNSVVGLPEMLTLTGAVLDPRALSLTALNFAQKSGKVGNALTKVKGLGQGVLKQGEQIAQSIMTN